MSAAGPLLDIGVPATEAFAQLGVLTVDGLRGVDLDELPKLYGIAPRAISVLQGCGKVCGGPSLKD